MTVRTGDGRRQGAGRAWLTCWCGMRNPYFETSPALMTSGCAGTGELECLCGGD